YFGAHRPAPETVFDSKDELLTLRVFEKGESGWTTASSYRAPGAAEALETAVPTALQLDVIAAAGLVVQNSSQPGAAATRVAVSLDNGRVVVSGDFKPERLLRAPAVGGAYRV